MSQTRRWEFEQKKMPLFYTLRALCAEFLGWPRDDCELKLRFTLGHCDTERSAVYYPLSPNVFVSLVKISYFIHYFVDFI